MHEFYELKDYHQWATFKAPDFNNIFNDPGRSHVRHYVLSPKGSEVFPNNPCKYFIAEDIRHRKGIRFTRGFLDLFELYSWLRNHKGWSWEQIMVEFYAS